MSPPVATTFRIPSTILCHNIWIIGDIRGCKPPHTDAIVLLSTMRIQPNHESLGPFVSVHQGLCVLLLYPMIILSTVFLRCNIWKACTISHSNHNPQKIYDHLLRSRSSFQRTIPTCGDFHGWQRFIKKSRSSKATISPS